MSSLNMEKALITGDAEAITLAGSPPLLSRKMRIAWIGEAGNTGGVPGLCRFFLRALAKMDIELDWYARMDPESVPEVAELRHRPNVRFFPFPFTWKWNSWYGRNPKLAFLVGFSKRIPTFNRLAAEVVRQHRLRPYDAVIQLSQGELLGLRRFAAELPIVLYPQTHAAGEARWCRLEKNLARQCEAWWWRWFRSAYLAYRSRLQKRDFHLARGVIGDSRRFNQVVSEDYMLPPERQGVVYTPIEVGRMRADVRTATNVVRLLYVGRISVRKGIEVMIEALPTLLASDDKLEVVLMGGGDQWSNYEPLLAQLPRERCTWRRGATNSQVIAEMEQTDILLVPSSYEPGGIVVTEALACGMMIAASEEVGSAENLPTSVRWTYPARNAQAFVTAVRGAVDAVRAGGLELRKAAREVAVDQFASDKMTRLLLSEVTRLTRTEAKGTPSPGEVGV